MKYYVIVKAWSGHDQWVLEIIAESKSDAAKLAKQAMRTPVDVVSVTSA